MPNTNTTASNLTGCDAEIPLLGVTREFDFGQFIELFDSTASDPAKPGVPVVARIVIQPQAKLAVESPTASAMAAGSAPRKLKKGPTISGPQAVAQAAEVNLFDLTERGPGAKLAPIEKKIEDPGSFFRTGTVQIEGKTYKVEVDAAMREALTMGLAVTAFASPSDGSGTALPLRLSHPVTEIHLTEKNLAEVLSGGSLDSAGGIEPVLTPGAIRALLAGSTVLTHAIDAKGRKSPVTLFPPTSEQEPMADSFQIFDLPSFLANPAVLAENGARLPVDLSPENVNELITTGRTRIIRRTRARQQKTVSLSAADKKSSEFDTYRDLADELGGDRVPPVKPEDKTWSEVVELAGTLSIYPYYEPYYEWSWGTPGTPQGSGAGAGQRPSSMTDKVQPRLPSGTGLPVAVFVPWKQTWTLKGFSRGNLLHSIALAPLEQITLQVFSWERRSRSLEQSSETDISQETEVTQTTRDTEDVFREMLAKHDFAWQLSGSLDASYSNGVASIQVNAGGSVSQTDSIAQTARNSSQRVRESTVKATSRVRSRRVTRIMQTVESGREERVTRLIRNPNQCHTLMLDFFETLAHYEIKLEFVKQRMRLVALVPNPINHGDFSSEIVRRNETTLRNALIEPALVDGFDACQTIAAYLEAKRLLDEQRSEAAKLEELTAQRDKAAPTGGPDPAAPQEAEVKRLADQMVVALKQIRTDAEIDSALTAIRDNQPVSEAARRTGQQWLFINFCAKKFPALLATLDELSGAATPPLPTAAAQKILAALPKPDAPTNLGNLNQIPDKEKEDSCIASKLREEQQQGPLRVRVYMKADWDWAWWTGRLREEGLYTANDVGLGGLADQLQKAYQAWEAKKAQGAAMKDQEVAKTEAEGRQDKATSDDKLAMAFPLDELARAYERSKVLRDHLNEHREFYNYALFQALPPSEQALRIVEASNGRLQVGLFEPRVVAMNGSRLVVPLTPLAGSQTLRDFVSTLADDLERAFSTTLATPDTTILPTPGVNVSSRLGQCSTCEEYIEHARGYELTRLKALAQQEQREAERRQKRLEAQNYDDFRESPPAVKLEVENKTPTP